MNLHIVLKILISTIAATSAMTLFSYAVSASAREVYKEPLLLTYVLTALHLKIPANFKIVLAWGLHYLIGLFFVMGYHFLWINNYVKLSLYSSIFLGAISGIIGIIGWIILFVIIPKKSTIDFKGYYLQLFIAHVIFGITALLVYKCFL